MLLIIGFVAGALIFSYKVSVFMKVLVALAALFLARVYRL
jgi:hypothetical protein